ncbi:MAG: hypothetical protein PVSMB8_09120 [Vulcanimicrobiaceae bacterium]
MIAALESDLISLAIGLAVMSGLVAIGALRLVATVKAFLSRVEAYADLPVVAYLNRASRKLSVSATRVEGAPVLFSRARAARCEMRRALNDIRTFFTTPTSLWRLGEFFVTGR